MLSVVEGAERLIDEMPGMLFPRNLVGALAAVKASFPGRHNPCR